MTAANIVEVIERTRIRLLTNGWANRQTNRRTDKVKPIRHTIKSSVIQVMPWWLRVGSHYLKQFGHSSSTPYDVIRFQLWHSGVSQYISRIYDKTRISKLSPLHTFLLFEKKTPHTPRKYTGVIQISQCNPFKWKREFKTCVSNSMPYKIYKWQ